MHINEKDIIFDGMIDMEISKRCSYYFMYLHSVDNLDGDLTSHLLRHEY